MTTRNLDAHRKGIYAQPLLAGLLAASARLAIVGGIAAWLFILLLNEIAAALVYVLATLLGLFFWSCHG